MRSLIVLRVCVFGLSLSLLTGCSDNGAGEPSLSKSIKDLNDDELKGVCQAVAREYDDFSTNVKKGACVLTGLVIADAVREPKVASMLPKDYPKTCADFSEACLAGKLPQNAGGARQLQEVVTRLESGFSKPSCEASDLRERWKQSAQACALTYGEVKTCFVDALNRVEDVFSSLTCSTQLASLRDQGGTPSCAQLTRQCPAFRDKIRPKFDVETENSGSDVTP